MLDHFFTLHEHAINKCLNIFHNIFVEHLILLSIESWFCILQLKWYRLITIGTLIVMKKFFPHPTLPDGFGKASGKLSNWCPVLESTNLLIIKSGKLCVEEALFRSVKPIHHHHFLWPS